MNRTRIAIAGLALLATACTGGNTTGTATTGTPTETKSPTSSSNADGDGKLASVKPCELISSSEATQLGLGGSPKPDKLAGKDICEWIDKNGGLTINLEPSQGADGFNYRGNIKTSTKFGKYDGFTAAPEQASGLCDAVISVTDSSSVQIVANVGASSKDTAKACERATKSAEFVAAKL